MRNDLSPEFISSKDSTSSAPRQLVVFKFEKAGDVYLSDQDITLNGILYRGLITDWGVLEDSADPEDDNSEVMQQTIIIDNSGSVPFSNLFLGEDPENVEVEIYQWYEGIADSSKALIDRFVVQDPISFDESSSSLTIDLVSLSLRYNNKMGEVLTLSDWPLAKSDDIGKGLDYPVGSPGEVKTIKSKDQPTALLDGPIISNSVSIKVLGDVSKFTQSGILQIDEELISYDSLVDNTFNATARGLYGTLATDHMDGKSVTRYATHSYLLGQGPLSSVSNVKVAGYPPPPSLYTIYKDEEYPRIDFLGGPYSVQFSAASNVESIDIDNTASGNTAWQPHYSYDDKPGTSSLISEVYPSLRVKQTDINNNTGQITRSILTIEHWSSNFYYNDRAEVWVEGIGVLGYLSRPASGDNLVIIGDVDIDHEQDHVSGGKHDHPFVDPGLDTINPLHDHSTDATEGRIGNAQFGTYGPYGISGGPAGETKEFNIWFNGLHKQASGSVINLPFSFITSGDADLQFIDVITDWGGSFTFEYLPSDFTGTLTINGGSWPAEYSTLNYKVKIRVGLYVTSGSISFTVQNPIIDYSAVVGSTNYKQTNIWSYVDVGGDVNYENSDISGLQIKDVGDVENFTGPNRDLNLYTENSPTKTMVDRFDLSDYIEPTWDWFNDREIRINYIGTADNINILVTNISFEVYVRKRERVYSDNVTAEIVLPGDNKPNDIIEDILINKAGLPASFIDGSSFTAAGDFYGANGYGLNGIIPASSSVRDAIRNILRQSRSRLIWNAGKCKLVVKEDFESWSFDKEILPENIQLKSISANRQKLSDVINKIDLLYDKDWVSDSVDPFKGTVSRIDSDSILKNGIREDRGKWLFDLVTTQSMATSLVNYYISTSAASSTFYNFNCYLDQFELEKEDKLKLTSSGFNSMVKLPLVIRSIRRIFGSSEAGQINLLNFIAESFRYIIINLSLDDQLSILESVNVVKGFIFEFNEIAQAEEEVLFQYNNIQGDLQEISESVLAVAGYAKAINESIATSEATTFELLLDLESIVTVTEQISILRDYGFGSGGFGTGVRFGGLKAWGETNPDEALIVEQLGFDMGFSLGDDQQITDNIYMSDGFGSPNIGDGFGATPFGA